MPRPSDARDRMVHAALALLQRRGAGGVGLLEVIAQAQAPRGSIYHHFPGGKDELMVAAIGLAAANAEAAILQAAQGASTPAQALRRIAAVFRHLPQRSDWTTGCPVAATAVDGEHQSGVVQQAVGEAFQRWAGAAAQSLQAAGLDAAHARQLGLALIAALEGGLLLARGLRSAEPYDATVEALAAALTAE